MSDLTDDLADIRNKLLVMTGASDYRLPLDQFTPSEHERLMLIRVLELTDVVHRLAERVEAADR